MCPPTSACVGEYQKILPVQTEKQDPILWTNNILFNKLVTQHNCFPPSLLPVRLWTQKSMWLLHPPLCLGSHLKSQLCTHLCPHPWTECASFCMGFTSLSKSWRPLNCHCFLYWHHYPSQRGRFWRRLVAAPLSKGITGPTETRGLRGFLGQLWLGTFQHQHSLPHPFPPLSSSSGPHTLSLMAIPSQMQAFSLEVFPPLIMLNCIHRGCITNNFILK